MLERLRALFRPGSAPETKSVVLGSGARGLFSLLSDTGGELWPGSFQQAQKLPTETLLTCDALYACVTLIAGDIAKLPLRLVEWTPDRIWQETDSPAFAPVLRKPNRYQTRIQFIQAWMTSKLTSGNAYVLKDRDNRGVVTALYVLDPSLVTPTVTLDGQVFYSLAADNLTGIAQAVVVPASEIIHDRTNPLFHPLVGVAPIYAAALAAGQGLAIQSESANFFRNASRPSGLVTVPATLDRKQAEDIARVWRESYSGINSHRVAVLGGGMTYAPIAVTANDAQLVEQLKLTARSVCMAYHVPPHKIGAEAPPAYANGEQMQQAYYAEALQIHIESIEALLDEGLGIGAGVNIGGRVLGTEFDVTALARMDSVQLADMLSRLTNGGIMASNEARRRLSLPKVEGGDQPFLQQQNWPIRDLAERPMPAEAPAAAAPQPAANDDSADLPEPVARELAGLFLRSALERTEPRPVALTA